VPRAEPDIITLQLQNAEGLTVDSWSVEEPNWGDPEDPNDPDEVDPDGDWRLLYGLFSEVHKYVTGWDKVVSDVEKALTGSGPIGASTSAQAPRLDPFRR
jgi:hypothetical protein